MRRSEKFPLWLHQSGNWCRKFRGKFYYFGHDRDAALRLYAEQWPAIEAGKDSQPVKVDADSLTVIDGFSRFLSAKEDAVIAGLIGARWHADLVAACEFATKILGRTRHIVTLSNADFTRLRDAAARKFGPVALGNFVQRVRSAFDWLHDSEILDTPVRFGPDFVKPKKRLIRLAAAEEPVKTLPRETILAALERADAHFRAMILLGINCGFGQTDCSELTRDVIQEGWIEYRRGKTGIRRRCPLWPETAAALDAVPQDRKPVDPEDGKLLFITPQGHRYVRHRTSKKGKFTRIDGISAGFKSILESFGASGSFYHLRHTHRTIAGEAKDRDAAALIMGHADSSMAGNYVHAISDARLMAVSDTIREWLLRSKS